MATATPSTRASVKPISVEHTSRPSGAKATQRTTPLQTSWVAPTAGRPKSIPPKSRLPQYPWMQPVKPSPGMPTMQPSAGPYSRTGPSRPSLQKINTPSNPFLIKMSSPSVPPTPWVVLEVLLQLYRQMKRELLPQFKRTIFSTPQAQEQGSLRLTGNCSGKASAHP